jgi:large subunit ribosomal protein L24
MPSAKIKKGDHVIVLTGRDKGKHGEVVRVMPQEKRALVRGVNMVRRHQKQTASQESGIVSKEGPINLSNLALEDPKDGKLARKYALPSAPAKSFLRGSDHGGRREEGGR